MQHWWAEEYLKNLTDPKRLNGIVYVQGDEKTQSVSRHKAYDVMKCQITCFPKGHKLCICTFIANKKNVYDA